MAYRNWTLRNPSNTIFPDGIPLTDTMPVDGSAVAIAQVVDNSNFEPITPAAPDEGAWVSPIDKHRTLTAETITAELFAASKYNSHLTPQPRVSAVV